MKLKDWRDVIEVDWSEIIITAKTVRRAREYKGQVRKPYEDKEYETIRQRILATPLPQ
jgi:hypothetical protein